MGIVLKNVNITGGKLSSTVNPTPDTDLEINGTPEGSFTAGSTIDLQLTDGVNPVTPNNVTLVGTALTIEVPSGGGGDDWQRPSDWLAMPTVLSTEDTFVGLYAIHPNGNNFAAFRFTTDTGQYQVDWGDGTVDLVNSNVIAEHTYDYDIYDPTDTTLSTRGYKQAIIVVTPVTGQLRTANFQLRRTTTPAQNLPYATGFLDCILSMPNANTDASIIFGGITVRHSFCERFNLLNSGNLTSMFNMFAVCISLQSILLINTSNVTNMGAMFNVCISLKSIPLIDTSNVTNMASLFSGCGALRTIPLLNTLSVTNMASMFANCNSLQSVPLLNTSNVTNMGSMFNGCNSLQSIPALSTAAITTTTGTDFTLFSNGCFSLDRCEMVFARTVNLLNGQLSRDALVEIFNNLVDRTSTTAANININNNWGALAGGLSLIDRDIALDKNWTITG
jgi:surface protein